MKLPKFSKKAVVIGSAVGLTLGLSGAALAYFTSSGTGTGSGGVTGSIQNDLSFSDDVSTAVTPAPGTAAQEFTSTVTNNGSQNEYVTTLKAYLTVSESSGGEAYTTSTGYTCSSADYYLDGEAGTTVSNLVTLAWTSQDLTAGGGHASTAGTDTIQFDDLGVNQDACEGATVTVNYVAS